MPLLRVAHLRFALPIAMAPCVGPAHALEFRQELPTIEDVLRDLASPSPGLRTLGFRELTELRRTAPAAEPRLAVELQGRALEMLLDGTQPWPAHPLYSDVGVRPYGWYLARRRSNERTMVILASDDLAPEVAAY